MSQAEMLLANLDDQSAAVTDDSLAEEHIVIDDNRYIKVPDSLKRLGVRGDHDIETVTIESPRYWDGHDMSQMKIYINYMCANGSKGQYPATNLQVADTRMTYDWTISSNVTQVNGKISFLVCIVKVDDEGYEERHWNSELNQECYVSDGLECDEAAIVRYPDIITYLLTRMEEVEAVADPEYLQNYVNEWLRENHTNMYILAEGETLEDAPADAIVVFDQNGESDEMPGEDDPSSSNTKTDISLNVSGATPGQIVKISAVDEAGTPTAWEAVDMPDTYSKAQIDAIMGSYINDVAVLVGGDA